MTLSLPLRGATFNVRNFGAKGDGTTFDTAAIQQALDSCTNGGDTVVFPAGTYLCQPMRLHSQTTVQLDAGALLEASTNYADFMRKRGNWLKSTNSAQFRPLIGGTNLTDITFTGTGIIDGNGQVWWGEAEKARQIRPGYTLPRPTLIALDHCQRIRLENITLRNSPKFHFVPADCDDVVVTNVTILAPEHAANTDAMDPSGRRLLITHCTLDVGDDNVAIKAGKKRKDGVVETGDIVIEYCTVLHGHGISIGSETDGGVSNMIVRNCTFADTENGLRIKSDIKRGGLVQNIRYENLTMTNVNPAILLTCVYQGVSSNDTGKPEKKDDPADGKVSDDQNSSEKLPRIPMYRDIFFSNITASCPKAAGVINGLPDSCVSNVVLENVNITAAKGFQIDHARGVQFKKSSVSGQTGPAWAGSDAEVTGLSAPE